MDLLNFKEKLLTDYCEDFISFYMKFQISQFKEEQISLAMVMNYIIIKSCYIAEAPYEKWLNKLINDAEKAFIEFGGQNPYVDKATLIKLLLIIAKKEKGADA